MTRAVLRFFIAVVLQSACAKSSGDGLADARASSTSSIASASPHGGSVADSSDAAPHAAGSGLEWRGSYASSASTVYVPADWKNVHWKGTETTAGIGQGVMALTIDAASGRVAGTLDGPLGPATLEGRAFGGSFTAAIARKDLADRGFVGTLTGTIANDHAEGMLNASLWDASALRSGTFTLSADRER